MITFPRGFIATKDGVLVLGTLSLRRERLFVAGLGCVTGLCEVDQVPRVEKRRGNLRNGKHVGF